MPRPKKCRKICGLPKRCYFGPLEGTITDDIIKMTVDEYETIRLIDHLGYNQENCSRQMGVARTTVQAVYNSARRKLAESLVDGKLLVIQGGNYVVCPKRASVVEKEVMKMKIAVTYENGQVFQHFGQTSEFKIYDVEDGEIVSAKVISTGGQGHGSLPVFLKDGGVDTVICGGIGGGARAGLTEIGIKVLPGVTGNADEQVEKLLAGDLVYDPSAECGHHHGEGHRCHE